jgi:hypothetical protein
VHEYQNCAASLLSTHFFSPNGKTWHFLPQAIQPYNHTVSRLRDTSIVSITSVSDAHNTWLALTHCHHSLRLILSEIYPLDPIYQVQYDDGTSYMFVTIERPTVFFDEHGQVSWHVL